MYSKVSKSLLSVRVRRPVASASGKCTLLIAEVIDQKYASVFDPRSSFSDRGLSHQTFDQVIDTKIWLFVGPRSLVLGNQRLLVLN